ncbi:MAG: hypothetical protein K2Y25_07445 [Pseudomonadaceae bacterium]|nr:hypothetical protein [Pseudomonadaceae bacterium]
MITSEEIAEWRALQGEGMVSAIGEYTPPEFWLVLDDLDAERAKVAELEKALKLVQSHAFTAWQRGNQAGISSNARAVREAVDAMNKARQVTLDENAIFTDLLERAEGRVGQLAALLREAHDTYRAAIHWEDLRGTMKRISTALAELTPQ